LRHGYTAKARPRPLARRPRQANGIRVEAAIPAASKRQEDTMPKSPAIAFSRPEPQAKGTLAFLIGKDGALPASAKPFDSAGQLTQAIAVGEFKGKLAATLEILAPGAGLDRIVLVGGGDLAANREPDWMRVGGALESACGKSAVATLLTDCPRGAPDAQAVAAIAAGARLRAYAFDAYRTKDRKTQPVRRLTVCCGEPANARKAWRDLEAAADGVALARDLVNEPANVLGPVEFAARAATLKSLGVSVEILDEKAMRRLGMGALLGVAQGSTRPPRLAVMQWQGGKPKQPPVAFIGKGVVFDTGGISIKPAAGMEDMKGDMGGAAAVTGLMHTLAARSAAVNAVGLVGLVENMPDGAAQRPGDIVTSMSGQTIEVVNTDAEGRLVLADVLWYARTRFKPQCMIDLATLTGAIIVSLGRHHAGLFANDDALAGRIADAGIATGERVWRMPMGPEYDKMIESRFADMKNVGDRDGGAISAAQFLARFVDKTPWAHLDIAGAAMNSPKNEYSQSWGSGFGVRLLDRLVADHYEKG
jgi:leucyl aminopeptidase